MLIHSLGSVLITILFHNGKCSLMSSPLLVFVDFNANTFVILKHYLFTTWIFNGIVSFCCCCTEVIVLYLKGAIRNIISLPDVVLYWMHTTTNRLCAGPPGSEQGAQHTQRPYNISFCCSCQDAPSSVHSKICPKPNKLNIAYDSF